jgi:hypothetical protein
MIGAFLNGFLNVIIFLFTKPSFWILLLVLSCMLIVGGIYPGAIYIYPYWQSKVDYVPVGIFDDIPLADIKTTVIVPSRLLPDAERVYSYTVEFDNKTKQDIPLKFSIDKDKPYASFLEYSELPIIEEIIIPGESKMTREYKFKVYETSSPRDPIRFTLRASIDGDSAAKTVILPIDYWSIPVVFIVGVIFTTILAILRLLLWFIVGI